MSHSSCNKQTYQYDHHMIDTALYIHIPFCQKKCGYCSFPVIPIEKLQGVGGLAEKYLQALKRDIHYFATQKYKNGTPSIKTIYFGGGTPLLFGAHYLTTILSEIIQAFRIKELDEISFEANPYPYESVLGTVRELESYCKNITKTCRFSFGIQSLHNSLLELSNRDCTSEGIHSFIENLTSQKPLTSIYNVDFIAYGYIQDQNETNKIKKLIQNSGIDSVSLYSLELFSGSDWFQSEQDPLLHYNAPWEHKIPFTTNEDLLYTNFIDVKTAILESGYERYEISNYAKKGKESIHNQYYWTMKPYFGIGLGAHGYIDGSRTVMKQNRSRYIQSGSLEVYEYAQESQQDYLIEKFFLGLRTNNGISTLSEFSTILVDGYEDICLLLEGEGLVIFTNNTLLLTEKGMDLHHRICIKLMKSI